VENLNSALPTLLIIFCIVFCSIILIRSIIIFLLYQARKKYQNLKKISNKILAKKLKKIPKEDDELFIKKTLTNSTNKNLNKDEKPYEIMPSNEQKNNLDDTKIVDIVKPIGFFTSMILGQKLTYLIQSAQIINKRENKGFWVSMIEAQERAAGRQHGRGR